MKSIDKKVVRTAKFLTYVLAYQPDEFGLIPDKDGFVQVKTLLKAMHEEQGFRHLRAAHLNEVVLKSDPSPIEIRDNEIRARDRDRLPGLSSNATPPKLLYVAIRQRAYPVALRNGINSSSTPGLILSSDKPMALRLGKRIDNQPVLLTVHVTDALSKGATFQKYGNHLFLTDHIPTGTFSGPPLPKEKPTMAKPAKVLPDNTPKTPGSFIPDLDPLYTPTNPDVDKNKRAEKKKSWQKERRLARRYKRRKG